jgi:hypothetical protein
MRVNVAIPEAEVSKPVLDAALESVTRLNEQLLKKGAPTFQEALKKGIKWKPEPPGQEHFDHAGIVAHRGHGDCDDLAPWEAASLRVTGTDPGAKAVVIRSGPQMWHAVVERSDGSHADPSKAAGMLRHHGYHGATLPLMHQPSAVVGGHFEPPRPTLALRPFPGGRYQARVDVPWYSPSGVNGDELTPTDYAMTALHTAPVPSQALVGAVMGAIELADAGGYANPEHLQRLSAVVDACNGCPPHELEQRYGTHHALAAQQLVGSFFGNLAHLVTAPITSAAHFVSHPSLSNFGHMFTDPLKAAVQTAQPLAQMAAPLAHFIPGVGPVAANALQQFGQHGLPSNFGELARFGMNMIPGMGGGGGSPMPMGPPPGFPPPGFPPPGYGMPPMGAPRYGMPPMGAPQAWPMAFR